MFKLKVFSAVILLALILGVANIKDSKAELADFDAMFNTEIKAKAVENTKLKKVDLGYMKASWYGPKFHGKLTANGELYDQMQLTAANKKLPFGTMLLLTNEANGKQVIVRVNDRGPYIGNRQLDLSKGAAIALGTIKEGVRKLKVEQLLPENEIKPVL